MFRTGQKVVCIHEGPWYNELGIVFEGPAPQYQQIYTIEGFAHPGYVHLVEINIDCPGVGRYCFADHCFKPVQTTDISIFQKMLNPTPTPEHVVG